ncbi:MAG: hypothetical protein U5L10_02085 [Candidatus Moranbacteria bacterium]|nr:hypothetical protein [Candidatus Moranbacteria bacterium]
MSLLNKLHSKLYSHNAKDVEKRDEFDDYYGISGAGNEDGGSEGLTQEKEKPVQKSSGGERAKKEKKSLSGRFASKRKWKWALLFLGALALSLLAFFGYVKFKQASFSQEGVEIRYESPENVKSGEEIVMNIVIDNKNLTSLEKAELRIKYPQEFLLRKADFLKPSGVNAVKIEVGKIPAKQEKRYELKFLSYSAVDSKAYVESNLVYQPSNFTSYFEESNSFAVRIKDSILGFSMIGEREIAKGEFAFMNFILENNHDKNFQDLAIKLKHSRDFTFEENKINIIEKGEEEVMIPVGSLGANERSEFEIRGKLGGALNSVKNFEAEIGIQKDDAFLPLTSDQLAIKLIPPRVELKQGPIDIDDDGAVGPGSVMNYRVSYKNNAGKPLSDLILKLDISGDVVDLTRMKTGRGYYDDDKKQVIWKASDIASLKHLNPGQTGEVSLEIPVKSDYEIWSEEDRNLTIETKANISSLNVQSDVLENKVIYSEEKQFKVQTQFRAYAAGVYDSDKFDNQGPFPPNQEKETELAINVDLTNTYNKVRNAKVYIPLSSGVRWKDNFEATHGEVSFNERTNELEWELDAVDFATGYLNPKERLFFQIGYKRSQTQVNLTENDINILNSVRYEAVDIFTGNKINKELRPLTLAGIKN